MSKKGLTYVFFWKAQPLAIVVTKIVIKHKNHHISINFDRINEWKMPLEPP